MHIDERAREHDASFKRSNLGIGHGKERLGGGDVIGDALVGSDIDVAPDPIVGGQYDDRFAAQILSPQAADILKDCQIDRMVRGREKASDHVPVWVELEV